MSTKRPDRDEYPEPSITDFATALERALTAGGNRKFSHHRVGRYTSTRTYTEHNPDTQPGDKVQVVRITECEREVIADLPVEEAGSVLHLLTEPEGVETHD